jgi:hypothetical protein
LDIIRPEAPFVGGVSFGGLRPGDCVRVESGLRGFDAISHVKGHVTNDLRNVVGLAVQIKEQLLPSRTWRLYAFFDTVWTPFKRTSQSEKAVPPMMATRSAILRNA